MARKFNSANLDTGSHGVAMNYAIGTIAVTYIPTEATRNEIIGFYESTGTDGQYDGFGGTGVGREVHLGRVGTTYRASLEDWGGTTNGRTVTGSTAVVGQQICLMMTWNVAGNMTYYENGKFVGSGTLVTMGNNGATVFNVNTTGYISAARQANGITSEIAMWREELTRNEALLYARGVPADQIRARALQQYFPIFGKKNPEIGYGGRLLTLAGTSGVATYARHPKMIDVGRRNIFLPVAAAAGGFQSAWARGSNVILGAGSP